MQGYFDARHNVKDFENLSFDDDITQTKRNLSELPVKRHGPHKFVNRIRYNLKEQSYVQ